MFDLDRMEAADRRLNALLGETRAAAQPAGRGEAAPAAPRCPYHTPHAKEVADAG